MPRRRIQAKDVQSNAKEAEKRISFILRLTVDERGQPRRTEVEHARSGNKETYPGLDLQRLAAFMEACISLPNHPTTDDPPTAGP